MLPPPYLSFRPIRVLTTDALGKKWLPGLLVEVRNGVALVQIEDYWTLRSLDEIRGNHPCNVVMCNHEECRKDWRG